MTDYHTHVLPGIDDGSKNVSMSLAMLEMLKQQGISSVACTSHYYPTREDPAHFLKRRDASFAALSEALPDGLPSLMPGAEFYFYEGISRLDCLDRFVIQGTDLLLVEMPFMKWSSRWVDELISMNERKDLRVMLAHVNRYLQYADPGMLKALAAENIAFQINNEAFSGFFRRRKALKLIDMASAFYLGSDAHNVESRAPNWDTLPSGIRSLNQ